MQRRSARLDPAARAKRAADAHEERERRLAKAARTAKEKDLLRGTTPLAFDADGCQVPSTEGGAVDPHFAGVLRWELSPEDFGCLREAHDEIKRRIRELGAPMGWAGGSDADDPRWRGFGLPPGARDRLKGELSFHSFETPAGSAAAAEEATRNWRSCVDYDPSPRVRAALARVAEHVAPLVAPEYAADVCVEQLMALQPNIQNGELSERERQRVRAGRWGGGPAGGSLSLPQHERWVERHAREPLSQVRTSCPATLTGLATTASAWSSSPSRCGATRTCCCATTRRTRRRRRPSR